VTADIHTLTGAYAANALADDERQAFEHHLAECASCRHEVAELQATLARLGVAAAEPPPPALRDRVMAEVDTLRQLPPPAQHAGGTASPAHRDVEAAVPRPRRVSSPATAARWTRAVLGVAAVLIVALVLSLVAVSRSYDNRVADTRAQLDRVAAVLTAPDARLVPAKVTGPAHGSVVVSARQGRAVVLAEGLPPTPAGRTYQLWLIDAGGATSAGLLSGNKGTVTRVVSADVSKVRGVGITVEPAGGSKRPTTQPVLLADIAASSG
jgi:anti-sigma-K factor RskA